MTKRAKAVLVFGGARGGMGLAIAFALSKMARGSDTMGDLAQTDASTLMPKLPPRSEKVRDPAGPRPPPDTQDWEQRKRKRRRR